VRRAAVVLLAWGVWLAVLTGVQAVFAPKPIQFSIPVVASAACVAAGLIVWALDARQGQGERPRLIADSSIATVALVLGVAVALLGAGFGLWLILIGAGIVALGLGVVVREQRARGRALHREASR
jgi:beta-lactamase regulating signal transducer with metallopeptidase domain